MPMRPHSASHSSMECVVRTVAHVRVRPATAPHRNRLAPASIPVEGSSKKRQSGAAPLLDGDPHRAMATDSLRLFPPLYCPANTSAYGVRETVPKSDSTSAFMRGPPC